MSITDELREYAHDCCARIDDDIHAIADRIDAEHEEAIQQVLMGEGGVPATDENMAEHGWIRLPVDADGVPIHVGDVMEWVPYNNTYQTVVRKVSAVGAGVFFAWSDEQGRYAQYKAHAYCHHHAPTVEDVLFDSLKHFGAVEERTPEVDKWLHEQAKRLTLAEEEDA